MSVLRDYFALVGGIDLVSPYLGVKAGRAIEAVNYEALPKGGYRRIDGYDRYDGHAARASVVHPTGSGPIRGVWVYNTDLYCFRDNAGATAGQMFKATTGGWVAQSLGEYIQFTAGNDAVSPAEGTTINGQTSGATAVVRRIVTNGGLYSGASATGLYVISGRVGNFTNGENLRVGAVVKSVANGSQVAITLQPGGTYEFINHNFFATTTLKRMYGVNGLQPAFEWDGTYFVPIIQGPAAIYPIHIEAHREHLFLGYALGSTFNSGTGDPLNWTAAAGAFEIGYGDAVRCLHAIRGGLLYVGCAESGYLVYGADSTEFEAKKFSDHGVRAMTTADIGGNVITLEELGLQNLITSLNFGDYTTQLLSFDINSALRTLMAGSEVPVGVACQSQDQYRIFFGTTGYYLTFNGSKLSGIMPVSYPDKVVCACKGFDSAGKEIMFFGSDTGKVFKMNTTNYFDGATVLAAMRLPFVYEKAPTQRKLFRKGVLDMKVTGAAINLGVVASYDFTIGQDVRLPTNSVGVSGGGTWNISNWNNFVWSGPWYASAELELDGTGQNMSLVIVSNGGEDASHTIYGVVLHYSARRLLR